MLLRKPVTKLIIGVLVIWIILAFIPFSQPVLAADPVFAAVSAGRSHSLAIKTDGSLWYWGTSSLRRPSDGIIVPSSPSNAVPVKIMENVTAASAGGNHSLVVKEDGSLWAWGLNDCGQLGDGTTADRVDPVFIMDGAVSVSTGYEHSLAIKTDGSLWAWGSNEYGQLGDGTGGERGDFSSVPVKVLDSVASVAAGFKHTLAVKTDGSLWAWGYNIYGQIGDGTHTIYNTVSNETEGIDIIPETHDKPSPVRIMDGVVSVSAGYYQSLAVKTDGSLWAWGGLNYNYLGGETSTLTEQYTPVQIMDSVASVSAGGQFTTVIKSDGSLWAWGYGPRGQIGAGDAVQSVYTPTRILGGVASVSSGDSHSLAIKTDGSLWAWGDNRAGQVGGIAPEHCYAPIQIFAIEISVIFNGRALEFDVPPYIVNSRTMVPLRVIFDELGASIVWDNATKTVTATKGDTVIILTIGDNSPTINGKVTTIDQPMIAISGRTMVPLRFVAEAFGIDVGWDPGTRTVTITS